MFPHVMTMISLILKGLHRQMQIGILVQIWGIRRRNDCQPIPRWKMDAWWSLPFMQT